MSTLLDVYVTGGVFTVILFTFLYTHHQNLGILPDEFSNTGLVGQIVMMVLLALLWPVFIFIMICGANR